jgi:hypothetical protein
MGVVSLMVIHVPDKSDAKNGKKHTTGRTEDAGKTRVVAFLKQTLCSDALAMRFRVSRGLGSLELVYGARVRE